MGKAIARDTIKIAVVRTETNTAENYKQAAFADRDGDPTFYVILQRAIRPLPQDRRLGLSGCYIETPLRGTTGYDLCVAASLEGKILTLKLKTGMSRTRLVALDLSGARFSSTSLAKCLTFILRNAFGRISTSAAPSR